MVQSSQLHSKKPEIIYRKNKATFTARRNYAEDWDEESKGLEGHKVQGDGSEMNNSISLDNWLRLSDENNTINAEPQGVKEFYGQKVLIYNNIAFIHIIEPFYSAGKQYHWQLQNKVGTGLSREFVDFAYIQTLTPGIMVGTKTDRFYQCNPIEILLKLKIL